MKLLVLDLDETLIHATKNKLLHEHNFKIADYYVYQRPSLTNFINEIKKDYKIGIWSSASDDYVKEIVEKIFPKEYPLEFVWGRTKCTLEYTYNFNKEFDYFNHLYYVKKLKKIHKKGIATLQNILIIDDTPHKCKHNYGNAIYPTEFLGDPTDDELIYLLKYLKKIKDFDNIRSLEKRDWKKETFI